MFSPIHSNRGGDTEIARADLRFQEESLSSEDEITEDLASPILPYKGKEEAASEQGSQDWRLCEKPKFT